MRDVILKSGERSEPLDGENYIIQSENGYRFGSDAVKLASFASARIGKTDRVYDLCSGCGVVGILLNIATGCSVRGAELDERLFDMSVRSCAYNGQSEVRFVNADVRDLTGIEPSAAFDAVVCNPPFYKADAKKRKTAPQANSELTVTFADVVRAAKHLLKAGGAFYIVHTLSRLDEVLRTCGDAALTPKNLVVNTNGKTFLLRCVRGGKLGLTVKTEKW